MNPASETPGRASALKAKVRLLDGGQSIAYVANGSGQELVLVHGTLCDYRYWEPQLERLCEHYHVIAPSLAHHYPRLPSTASQPFSWERHVTQLASFLATLEGGRVHLVAHSRGGCIAYQLALRHPRLLRSLTLVDPGGPLDHPDSEPAAPSEEAQALRARAVALIEQGYTEEGLRLFVDSVSQPGFWDRSLPRFRHMV